MSYLFIIFPIIVLGFLSSFKSLKEESFKLYLLYTFIFLSFSPFKESALFSIMEKNNLFVSETIKVLIVLRVLKYFFINNYYIL